MVYIHVTHMDTIRLESEIITMFFVKCIINIVFLKIKLNDYVSCFIYQYSILLNTREILGKSWEILGNPRKS